MRLFRLFTQNLDQKGTDIWRAEVLVSLILGTLPEPKRHTNGQFEWQLPASVPGPRIPSVQLGGREYRKGSIPPPVSCAVQ